MNDGCLSEEEIQGDVNITLNIYLHERFFLLKDLIIIRHQKQL